MNKSEMGITLPVLASSDIGPDTTLPNKQAEAVTAKVAPNGELP